MSGTATTLHTAGSHRRCCNLIQSDAAPLRRRQMGDVKSLCCVNHHKTTLPLKPNQTKLLFLVKLLPLVLSRLLRCGRQFIAYVFFPTIHNEWSDGTAVHLTFRHRASCIRDRRFATLHRTLFIYLINKYISLSDICLTVHH